jgi:hypothetical protein
MVLGHPLAQLFLVVRSVRMVQLAQPLQGEAEYSALAAAVRYGQRIRSCAEAGGQMRHRLLVCEGSEPEWGMREDNRRGKPRRTEIAAFMVSWLFGIHHGAVDDHRRGSRATTCGDGSEYGQEGKRTILKSGPRIASCKPTRIQAWRQPENYQYRAAGGNRSSRIVRRQLPGSGTVSTIPPWVTAIQNTGFAGLDPKRGTERPTTIETGRSVVINEDMTEAVISKEGAAEFSNIRGRFQPALRLIIEKSKFLQLPILFFS